MKNMLQYCTKAGQEYFIEKIVLLGDPLQLRFTWIFFNNFF